MLYVRQKYRFNWATRSHAWKLWQRLTKRRQNCLLQLGHAFSRVETNRAGTGPRDEISLQLGHAFSRVETKMRKFNSHKFIWLQLGHAFSRVETADLGSMAYLTTPASIGPRVLTRGNIFRSAPVVKPAPASIGPRVLTRGNSGGGRNVQRHLLTLQLGHAFSRVETHYLV